MLNREPSSRSLSYIGSCVRVWCVCVEAAPQVTHSVETHKVHDALELVGRLVVFGVQLLAVAAGRGCVSHTDVSLLFYATHHHDATPAAMMGIPSSRSSAILLSKLAAVSSCTAEVDPRGIAEAHSATEAAKTRARSARVVRCIVLGFASTPSANFANEVFKC